MKLILTLALVSTSLLLSNCAANGQCMFGKKKASACCSKPTTATCCATHGATCKTKH